MAYIGNSPALNESVTSAQIAADAITGAKIADDAIESEHYANTSIDAAHLASGVGGTGWLKISKATVSVAVSELDITSGIDSTYDTYMITYENVHSVDDGVYFRVRLYISSTLEDDDADYTFHQQKQTEGGSSYSAIVATDAAQINISNAIGNAAGEATNGYVTLHSPAATDQRAAIGARDVGLGGSGNTHHGLTSGHFINSSGACTGIRFLFSGGNIASGVFTLYGLVN